MKKMSLSALAAVGVLAGMTGVNAADLGGNCCADLEERIAELEATTARKGNRKVSLTISGWVSQQVSFWDDGLEKNAYVSDIGTTLNSNFKLTGSAKISPDVSAGYVIHVEVTGNENVLLNANTDSSAAGTPGKGLQVIQSFWFLKSETLGKISVGTQSSAADNVAVLPDGSGSLIFANYIMYDVNAFGVRNKGTKTQSGASWGQFASCQSLQGGPDGGAALGADCDGYPNNNVRYDTPTVAGFSASASWGEDDVWAVAARYAGEFSGFKLAAAIGYVDVTDDNGDAIVKARGGKQASALQIGAYLQNIPTGLFVYGAYGKDYNDRTGGLNGAGVQQISGQNYYFKAGIRQKFMPYGATVLYGEYGKNEDKLTNSLWRAGASGSNLEQYGVGIVQEIDAAAMSLFANYRHYNAELSCGAANTVAVAGACAGAAGKKLGFEDMQLFKVGAIINF
jgi:hypothetical protein